jgi:hypothetical protein
MLTMNPIRRNAWYFTLAGTALILVLTACSPGNVPVTGGEGTLESPPPQAVLAAVNQLSQTLGVSVESVEILDFQEVEWPDACLGVPQEDEACALVITPGFRIMLEADGRQFELHSNQDGTVIVQVP